MAEAGYFDPERLSSLRRMDSPLEGHPNMRALGKENENTVVVDGDVGNSTRTHYFGDEFPERFFNVGIAESNLVGAAMETGGIVTAEEHLLARHGAAFCIYHMHDFASPREVTADFIYARLHGTSGTYQGGYSPQQLSRWAGAFSAWLDQGKDVFCYFNNDEGGHAPQDAQRLRKMLE